MDKKIEQVKEELGVNGADPFAEDNEIIKHIYNEIFDDDLQDYIYSTDMPAVYMSNKDDEYPISYKWERIYNYCYNNFCNRIICWFDDVDFNNKNSLDSFDQYKDMLEAIEDGRVKNLVLYSINDIPGDIYHLLYLCKNSDVNINFLLVDENIKYTDEQLALLTYTGVVNN